MLLLIEIFSINKGRGYVNPSLDIIVIECCSTRGFPLEEACEHCFQNQSVIVVVVLISFLCYCGDYAGYITIILPFLAFYFCSAYFLIYGILQVVSEHHPWQKLWELFSRVEPYSSIFKPQISVVTHINPRLRDSYTQEIQVVLKHTSVATLVTIVGTPSSGSTSDNTCVRIDLYFLKPSLDKSIGRLTVIVPPRTALGKILSSTWVVK
jgi:hypothetical protein